MNTPITIRFEIYSPEQFRMFDNMPGLHVRDVDATSLVSYVEKALVDNWAAVYVYDEVSPSMLAIALEHFAGAQAVLLDGNTVVARFYDAA